MVKLEMKKLNEEKLSKKQIDKIKQKAAFSQFVASLQKLPEVGWVCCSVTFSSTQELHKHVSCTHMDTVKQNFQDISRNSHDVQIPTTKDCLFLSLNAQEHICSCVSRTYVVILFYHYVALTFHLDSLKEWQEKLCANLKLKGKIRLASEGINGTVEGCQCCIDAYTRTLINSGVFRNLAQKDFKCSSGTGQSFDSLVVSVCEELCTMGIVPSKLNHSKGGKYLTPEQFHDALEKMQDLKENNTNSTNSPILLDCRNFYESKIGYFANAVTPDLRKFSYFPEYIDKNKDLFEGREVLTYCTGGIRCERATAYIKKSTNCSTVFQLQGGIHKYLEQYPNGFFKGRLFVFDNRYSIGPNNSDVTSSCFYCPLPCNEYRLCSGRTCRQLVLICSNCTKSGKSFCCEMCRVNHREENTTEQCTCTALRDRIPKEKLPT